MEVYRAKAPLTLMLKGSPSLLLNNLSSRRDFKAFVYVHLDEVVFISIAATNVFHKIPATPKTHIYQTAFIEVQGSSFLIITASDGAYIWTADGTSMLYFLSLTDIISGRESELDFQFMRGITSNQGSVFLGTSLGHILEIVIPNSSGESGVELVSTICESKTPISCLATLPDMDLLISGNDRGDISGFSTCPTLQSKSLFVWTGSNHPCTALIARNNFIIAGFSSGHIRAYRPSSGELVMELTAHVRCITGMALHPTQNMFVSVAEDQHVCFWSVNNSDLGSASGRGIELLSAEKLENRLNTGVCFLGEDRVGVVAYDEDDVIVLQRGDK